MWYKTAIFYEVYVRAFADGNGDGHGDFIGLTNKLDYFVDLGVDCLWLLPMYPSPLQDDGYDISDYEHIHPDYGTLEDFKTFLAEAHKRGLRVISDLVLNHTSDQHPWFQAARASKDNAYRDYYVWSASDQKYQDTRIIFLDTEPSNWTLDPATNEYYWHRFYASQPDLNYDNPAVADAMIEVLKYWMGLGLDGFRADAVPYLFEREGTNCENLPETHAYLKRVRRVLDEHFPEAILLGEANQWPKDLRPYFGGDPQNPAVPGDEFHMAFHFPVMPRIYKALKLEDATDILQIMADTPAIPANCQWCVFLRNHDELTLEMVTEEDRQLMWNLYAPEPRMRLNLGIRRRLAPLLDNDRPKIELANSILFTLPGAPIIYYGDEIGMGDNLNLPDRHGVRTPMQWANASNAGFSTAPQPYAPAIDDEVFGYHQVNVQAQRADPASLWHALKRLIAIRKMYPTLSDSECHFLTGLPKAILAFTRGPQADPQFLVLHNLSAESQTVALPAFSNERWRDVLADRIWDKPTSFALAPYQSLWLKREV